MSRLVHACEQSGLEHFDPYALWDKAVRALRVIAGRDSPRAEPITYISPAITHRRPFYEEILDEFNTMSSRTVSRTIFTD